MSAIRKKSKDEDQPQTLSKPPYDRAALVKKWVRFYNGRPPKGISRQTLELAVAYHRQARQHGGLPANRVKQLIRIAKQKKMGPLPISKSQQLKPGARLIREWRGQSYVVDILEKGYLWQKQVYGSLSEVAREITGARWSGPRFFGVKD